VTLSLYAVEITYMVDIVAGVLKRSMLPSESRDIDE
jgi:hypothetical protein